MRFVGRRRLAALCGLLGLVATAGPSSAAASSDTVILRSGAVLEGRVLKRNDRRVWLDVGDTVLVLEADTIEEIRQAGADAADEEGGTDDGRLYRTATDLPELSPREQARRVGPTVVKVSTPSGLGSGVFISPDGYAITNAHVIQGETAIRATVWLPDEAGGLRREIVDDVEIVAVNNHLDLALLRIPHPEEDGRYRAALLERDEKIEVGQVVFAIGNPLGLEQTLSQGVVSTRQRSFDGLSYIQTDAAINPGNSGGPLFDVRGQVVGITNMGILGGEALGFAIPARYVKDFIRNRDAFAYDPTNPNSGHVYHAPPRRVRFGTPPERSGEGAG